MFDSKLEEEGLITHKGTIIDASFVDVPRQRNIRDENKKIKEGEIPEEWMAAENSVKIRYAKGSRNHPLAEDQRERNRIKSKVRCRIEHIFGYMTNSMHGITIRSIAITRAWFNIGMMNLIYNFFRYEFLKRDCI